ncbi:multidrug efflux SMR transporter [Paraglaciecola sp. L3A3]|uniref:DMT family transporter n=1 Tax=Paraglaciecola sp. L3A3 TaxID=2686358 RepID=UPI00131B56F7|nr:SMR family transporter [Paraglaciecola sp. L3A3]
MSWLLLLIAGILEGAWIYGVQKSAGFTHIYYTLFAIFSMSASLLLFALAIKTIPTAQAYIIWLAIGVCSICIVDHFIFKQILSAQQLVFLCLIIIGVVGLKLSH